jgi:hypothetical protein
VVVVGTIAALACACLALIAPAGSRQSWRAAALFVQAAFSCAALVWAHARTRRHASSPRTRMATLVPRDGRLPGGRAVALGPLALLALVGAVIFLNRPIGSDAQFNHSLVALAVGTAVVSIILGIGFALTRQTRQITLDERRSRIEQQSKRWSAAVLVASAYCVALFFSMVALRSTPAFQRGAFPFVDAADWSALAGLLLVSALAIGIFAFTRPGRHAVLAIDPGDGTPDAAWKGGLIYFNPGDPALVVENRNGLGWTLNFARWRLWLVVAGVGVLVLGRALLG